MNICVIFSFRPVFKLHFAADVFLLCVCMANIYNYYSTSIRWSFDCLSKVIKVTVT